MSTKLRCVKSDLRSSRLKTATTKTIGARTTSTSVKTSTSGTIRKAITKKSKSAPALKRKISTISTGTQTTSTSIPTTVSPFEVASLPTSESLLQTSVSLRIARTMAMAAKMATKTASSMLTIPTSSAIMAPIIDETPKLMEVPKSMETQKPIEMPRSMGTKTMQSPKPTLTTAAVLPPTTASSTSPPTSAKSKSSTAKTKATKSGQKTQFFSLTSTRSPFNSFVTTGSRRRQRSQSFDFAYDLSKDEVHFAGSFEGPMKRVPANERELLTSGQREAYLAMRYGHSPDRKYNYPEATSWRIGWFHNQQSNLQKQNLQKQQMAC